jgi:glycosyltransferase involved in cell wall biosynthesis
MGKLEKFIFFSDALDEGLPLKPRSELTISVLIVTRNRAQLLERALQSIVEQKRQPEQVVVVDNASTDETALVAGKFADKLNLTVVPEKTVGIPYARNSGLAHCTEDIVAIVDDDCVADCRWLAELENPFLKDPRVGAVGGSVLPMEGQDELISQFYGSRMDPKHHKTAEGAK